MSEQDKEQKEDDSERKLLDRVSEFAFRGPKKGTRKSLIAYHLASATSSTETKTVFYHVCSASMHVKPDEIPGLDLDLLKRMLIVNQTLGNPQFVKYPVQYIDHYGWRYREVYSLLWSFERTEQNFAVYIEPWQKTPFTIYEEYVHSETPTEKVSYAQCAACGAKFLRVRDEELQKCKTTIERVVAERFFVQKTRKEKRINEYALTSVRYMPLVYFVDAEYEMFVCPRCNVEQKPDAYEISEGTEAVEIPYFQFFFKATRYLQPEGYKCLCRSFSDWGHPIVMAAKALLSDFVTPELLAEAMQAIRQQATDDEGEQTN